jgi:formate hydrogenlyase subunit 3/multisubunit Na+/H+ antiporter MnhD subunit
MLLVVLANDALFFLVAWELMAVASYFLVVFEDERVENRRAGFLYLVVAHVGAVAILLAFGILAGLGTGFAPRGLSFGRCAEPVAAGLSDRRLPAGLLQTRQAGVIRCTPAARGRPVAPSMSR